MQDANFVKFSEELMSYCPDSHLKCLYWQLLLQFQSDWLYIWQKFPFGVLDVQDANYVKIPSRKSSCPWFDLKMLVLTTPGTLPVRFTCPDKSFYNFSPIRFYTWQKCPFRVLDVQDANFVKIPSRITELMPLIWLKNAYPDNSLYSFCLIHFKLAEVFIRSCRCARRTFRENSMEN